MKIGKTLWANIPAILFSLFLGVFSLGQLQRIQLTPRIAFYAHDILIMMFIIWSFLKNKKFSHFFQKIPEKIKKIVTRFPLETTWLLWIALGMGIGLATGTLSTRSLLYALRLGVYILFLLCVYTSRAQLPSPKKMLAGLGILLAGWGLVQYTFIPDTRFLHILGWDNHYYRLIGTLFDPAFMGMMLVLVFGAWQFPEVSKNIPHRWRVGIQTLLVVAIAATFSRASYLSLATFLFLQGIRKKITTTTALFFGFVFTLTILLLPKPGGEGVNLARTSTGEARFENAQQNLIALEGTQWIWGRGLFNTNGAENFDVPYHAAFPDSFPVLVVNATGVVGSVLTLAVGTKWLARWWREKPVWSALASAVLVHSLFNNTLLQPFVFLTLWLLF